MEGVSKAMAAIPILPTGSSWLSVLPPPDATHCVRE